MKEFWNLMTKGQETSHATLTVNSTLPVLNNSARCNSILATRVQKGQRLTHIRCSLLAHVRH